ncbi:two-component system sensor histidine kinase NtrB [Shumkonia mesophila]|uniref:two-component system sensor histidine kinase NtrB n=1 Tax=Shumkonia mesophila TaxID=2838854 RepID=UPI002934F180|nr:ATP-binding protein [Shumkonia mesophila]
MMGIREFAQRKKRKVLAVKLDAGAVLNALPMAVVVVAEDGTILHVNDTGEQFFHGSATHLRGQRLQDMIPEDSPLFSVIEQARNDGNAVFEYGLNLNSPRIGRYFVNVQARPMMDDSRAVVLGLQERSIADKIDHQMSHRGAARSVSAMAHMLAHEVKNPLSGIRGAAQLLEDTLDAQDRSLTQLIRGEVDRIVALVDRMEVFSDTGPLRREAVNIHEVLTRVRQLAENGFGRHVRIVENYDPSLPAVLGNRDQLVQVFLNLAKNAVEAVPTVGGEVVLRTAYRPGVRFALAGRDSREHLPLMVSVEDNGEGIPEDMRAHIFDPFVTSKPKGSGLGLALVAKIIDDHGGAIEVDSAYKRTVIRVMLPMVRPVVEYPEGGAE